MIEVFAITFATVLTAELVGDKFLFTTGNRCQCWNP